METKYKGVMLDLVKIIVNGKLNNILQIIGDGDAKASKTLIKALRAANNSMTCDALMITAIIAMMIERADDKYGLSFLKSMNTWATLSENADSLHRQYAAAADALTDEDKALVSKVAAGCSMDGGHIYNEYASVILGEGK